jgi:hypothetical protein
MPEGSLELVRSGGESERQNCVRERSRHFYFDFVPALPTQGTNPQLTAA